MCIYMRSFPGSAFFRVLRSEHANLKKSQLFILKLKSKISGGGDSKVKKELRMFKSNVRLKFVFY